MTYISNNTICCDRCMRSLDGKSWIEIDGMKICGICQFEVRFKAKQEDMPDGINKFINDNFWDLI